MMLTPAAPRAGPIGGAGLAFPAGIASLIIRSTFVAICGCCGRQQPESGTCAAGLRCGGLCHHGDLNCVNRGRDHRGPGHRSATKGWNEETVRRADGDCQHGMNDSPHPL